MGDDDVREIMILDDQDPRKGEVNPVNHHQTIQDFDLGLVADLAQNRNRKEDTIKNDELEAEEVGVVDRNHITIFFEKCLYY